MTNGDGVCGFENLDEFKQGQVQSSWITPTPYLFIPVFAKPQTPSPLVHWSNAILEIFVCCCKHEFDSIDLVNFACARIVVDSDNVGARICISEFFYDTFTYDVVWKASKWLGTYDVAGTLMDEFDHLTC